MLKYRNIVDNQWYGIDLMALRCIYAIGECRIVIQMKNGEKMVSDLIIVE